MAEALSGYDDIVVAGSEWSGQRALEFIRATPPDVVTLDVSMPGLDGLQTARAIQHHNQTRTDGPAVGVIMVSASQLSTEQTMEALQAGAVDCITKPAGDSVEGNLQELAQVLLPKIRQCVRRQSSRPATPTPPSLPAVPRPRSSKIHHFKAVLIAVSTGGPEALLKLLPALCERIDLPVFIVQHIQADMIPTLVGSFKGKCRHPVTEAREGAVVQPGTVYFAPGGKHLVLRQGPAGAVVTLLTDQPPENNCRPSADVLFRSAAQVYGGDVIVLMLTGMLHDGTNGLGPLKLRRRPRHRPGRGQQRGLGHARQRRRCRPCR